MFSSLFLAMPRHGGAQNASLPLAYVPGIYFFVARGRIDVDGRDKPGHDDERE